MEQDAIVSLLSKMTDAQQLLFLAKLSCNLTIAGRHALPGASPDLTVDQQIRRLEGVNECQHRIAAQLISILKPSDARYPDEALCAVLFEVAAEYEFTDDFSRALDGTAI